MNSVTDNFNSMARILDKISLAIRFLIGENTTVRGRKWNQIHREWRIRRA